MPLLGALLTTLLGSLGGLLAKIWAAQLVVRVAAISALGAVTAALFLVWNTQVAPLVAQLFQTQYGSFLGLAFPPVAGTCMATFTTVWVACLAYRLKERLILVGAKA